jgi:hypothetical protein
LQHAEIAIINLSLDETYELSPMQQGMLFDSVQSSVADVYCMVVAYTLRGPLKREPFIRAWQHVVDRHSILRTSFEWDEKTEPRQRVHRTATPEVFEDDWHSDDDLAQRTRLTSLLQSESRRGFDLRTAPLMRLALVQCGHELHQFVVSQHHILMDGSCKQLLFHEVFTAYASICAGHMPDLPPPTPYRDYIVWLRTQDMSAAEAFWRTELRGFTEPTRLSPAPQADPARADAYEEHEVHLDEIATEALKLSARRSRLTLNSIVSGVWALILARASRQRDVVFGTTVNARPPALQTEAVIGLFINTLPLRVRVVPELSLPTWLRGIQSAIAGAREFDFAPLWRIQRWSDVPPGKPLFESIVVFENNPGYGSATEQYGAIAIVGVRPFTRNSLPLTVRVVPGETLGIQLLYDVHRFTPDTIRLVADQMITLLREIGNNAERPLQDLLTRLDVIALAHHAADARAFQSSMREKLRHLGRERRRAIKP